MALWLRQSQAVTIVIGPMLTDSDGKTPLTALDVTTDIGADIYKWDNDGTPVGYTRADLTLTASGGDNDCVHLANGYYSLELTATNTNELGPLIITTNPTGGLPTWQMFMVVPANVYNSTVLGSDYLYVDALEINSSSTAADRLQASADTIVAGTVSEDGAPTYTASNGGGALVFYSDDVTDATEDTYAGRVIYFDAGGDLGRQAVAITAYELVAATYGKFTCSQATGVPADNDTFIIM